MVYPRFGFFIYLLHALLVLSLLLIIYFNICVFGFYDRILL